VENSCFKKKYNKINKINKWESVCNQSKKGTANKFQISNLKMLIPMVEMLLKEMQSVWNFFFFKIVEIETASKVQRFFPK
jgi:hypothetical protein